MTAFWIICAFGFAAATLLLLGPSRPVGRSKAALIAGALAAASATAFAASGGWPRPGEPYAARIAALLRTDPAALSDGERLAVLEAVARRRPQDAAAQAFLAAELSRAGRAFEAVQARERVVSLAPSAQSYSALGEALTALNEGAVGPDAARAFEAALALDPGEPSAQWFLGLAAEQRGDAAAAAERWGALLVSLAEDDPRRAAIAAAAVSRLSRPRAAAGFGAAPPLARGEDVRAAALAMVERLDARLAEAPDDIAGWLTLARGRLVLGDAEGAAAALGQAEAAFAGEEGALLLIEAARAGLLSVTPAEG